MTKYTKGDHVSWNSEAGDISGKNITVHHVVFDYKGHRRRASKNEAQYEIKSDKTDDIADHQEDTLEKIK